MTEPEEHQRGIDSGSLWRVIEELETGTLSESGREELTKVLAESRRARQVYLEYFEMVSLLNAEAETQKEAGTLPLLPGVRGQRKILRYSVLAAAAVLAIFAVVASLVNLKQVEPRTLAVEAVTGSAWVITGGEEGRDPSLGTIGEGESVELSSGLLVFTSDAGAQMVLQGPATVHFPQLDKPVIETGWLWYDSGAKGEKLLIETPDLYLRNVGTRFGMRVRGDHRTELHLIEGMVEVETKASGQSERYFAENSGLTFAVDGTATSMEVAADPFLVLPRLLAAPPMYSTTIMGQRPVGYWQMNEPFIGDMKNTVSAGMVGSYDDHVEANVPGMRPEDGFLGFREDNRGAFLPGDSEKSVLYYLDSPQGVSPKEGAVAFWFRHGGELKKPQVMWFAGTPRAGGLGPQDEMHTFLSTDGRVQFFMEDGERDVLLGSPRSSSDGKWHHLVVSWDSAAVDLYIDGKLASRDEEKRRAAGPNIAGTNVRFGKTGSEAWRGIRDLQSYRGWVDELVLWDRPLTEAEVRMQYRSAVGKGE